MSNRIVVDFVHIIGDTQEFTISLLVTIIKFRMTNPPLFYDPASSSDHSFAGVTFNRLTSMGQRIPSTGLFFLLLSVFHGIRF